MTFSHKLFWKIELNLLLTHSTVWNIYTTNGRLNETHFYFLQDSSLKLQTSSNISVFWVMLKHLFVCFLFLTVSETIKCNIYYVFKTLERIQRLANIVRMTTRCCHLVERILVKQLKWILRWIRKKKKRKLQTYLFQHHVKFNRKQSLTLVVYLYVPTTATLYAIISHQFLLQASSSAYHSLFAAFYSEKEVLKRLRDSFKAFVNIGNI